MVGLATSAHHEQRRPRPAAVTPRRVLTAARRVRRGEQVGAGPARASHKLTRRAAIERTIVTPFYTYTFTWASQVLTPSSGSWPGHGIIISAPPTGGGGLKKCFFSLQSTHLQGKMLQLHHTSQPVARRMDTTAMGNARTRTRNHRCRSRVALATLLRL